MYFGTTNLAKITKTIIMEQQSPKPSTFALRYGIIQGAISIVFVLILFFMDMHYQGGIPILIVSILIMLGVIITALMDYKKANGGFMTVSDGLKIGMGLALIGGIISMLFNFLLTKVIDPEMQAKAMQLAEAQMVDRGMSKEQIEASLEMAKKFQAPWIQAAFGLIFSIFFGFILTLIPALIMKKSESDF